MSDMFIDNDRIRSMGYEVKVQNNTSGSGRHIMDYLKKIVPKMFQVILDIYKMDHTLGHGRTNVWER